MMGFCLHNKLIYILSWAREIRSVLTFVFYGDLISILVDCYLFVFDGPSLNDEVVLFLPRLGPLSQGGEPCSDC